MTELTQLRVYLFKRMFNLARLTDERTIGPQITIKYKRPMPASETTTAAAAVTRVDPSSGNSRGLL